MRKEPGSVYDKCNMSVVICDTDNSCVTNNRYIIDTFMILYNNAAYATMCLDSGWHFTRIWKTHGGMMSLRGEGR